MTQTVYGVALDQLGHARDGTRFWATPSSMLRSVQDETIPVDVDHGRQCGEVIFIRRARDGRVWLVAEVNDDVSPQVRVRVGTETRSVPTPFYWSVSRIGGPDHGFVLGPVALTSHPARVNARPVEFRAGDAHMAAYQSHDRFERELLERAHEYDLRRHGAPLVVVDDDPALLEAAPFQHASRQQSAPIEYRSSVEVSDVSTSERSLEVIVMPWETPAVVLHRGRRVHEIVAHGAFDTIDRSGGRVKVNLDHDPAQPVGKAVAFNPDHLDGLWARLKIAKTRAGDETLELAQEEILDISAGFAVREGGETWPSQNLRLLHKLHLDHIAMVSNPAYPDARVLSVRDDEASRTPNLDRVLAGR